MLLGWVDDGEGGWKMGQKLENSEAIQNQLMPTKHTTHEWVKDTAPFRAMTFYFFALGSGHIK